jgi:hypothetical protein
MAKCPTCGTIVHERGGGIQAVAYSRNNSVGGCNFCSRHITSDGGTPHAVLQLSGAGLLARVCQDCASELLPTLQAFAKGGR